MYTIHNAQTLGELARKLTQAAQIHGTDCTWENDESGNLIIQKGEKAVGHVEKGEPDGS